MRRGCSRRGMCMTACGTLARCARRDAPFCRNASKHSGVTAISARQYSAFSSALSLPAVVLVASITWHRRPICAFVHVWFALCAHGKPGAIWLCMACTAGELAGQRTIAGASTYDMPSSTFFMTAVSNAIAFFCAACELQLHRGTAARMLRHRREADSIVQSTNHLGSSSAVCCYTSHAAWSTCTSGASLETSSATLATLLAKLRGRSTRSTACPRSRHARASAFMTSSLLLLSVLASSVLRACLSLSLGGMLVFGLRLQHGAEHSFSFIYTINSYHLSDAGCLAHCASCMGRGEAPNASPRSPLPRRAATCTSARAAAQRGPTAHHLAVCCR